MKNDALNHFKEEMNKRGLIRKIQVCANLIPPPPDADPERGQLCGRCDPGDE